MAALAFRFEQGAVHLPELGLWLDAHQPIGPEETVFVSHAHSDHTAAHARVILSPVTQRLMRARIGGIRTEHVLEFGRRYPSAELGMAPSAFDLTLLPAGHIFGSAMSLIETDAASLLYTGDFKLRPGLSAELCAPKSAEVLVMETTYGRPQYAFPSTPEIMAGIVRFCREAVDNDETPVLLGYSLGKSQEILSGLAGAGLPIMLSGPVAKLTAVYESFGVKFPAYTELDLKSAAGHVVLAPPGATVNTLRRKLGRCRVAMLTGWAIDPGCRFRYQADAAFPLSDHADFPDLVEFVKRVAPRKVYTLHGFAADFAAHLRELGFDAQALTEAEQLELGLKTTSDRAPRGEAPQTTADGPSAETPDARGSSLPAHCSPLSFQSFARTCAAIGAVRSKREKIHLLAGYLSGVEPGVLPNLVTWFTGAAFASSANKPLSVGWAALRGAICDVAGLTESQFRNVYLKHSDTGETVAEVFDRRPALRASGAEALSAREVTLAEVAALFDRLQTARGPTRKQPLLTETLRRCDPLEAKFLVKILTGDLRIGLQEGLVEEGVAKAFEVGADAVRAAGQLIGNLGEVALLARSGRLAEAGIVPFRALKLMLASPEPTAGAVMARVNEWGADPAAAPVAWLEDKYDGIRCQLHKVGDRVALFTRDLKDITETFPELADAARGLAPDVILDGEALAMDGERARPFSELQKRLGRRERDLFLGGDIPVRFVAFDLLWQDGATLLNEPLQHRRARLDALALVPGLLRAAVRPARTEAEIAAAFTAARARGNEGLMIKDPRSAYSPGRRGLAWLKLKHALGTLDCVVVGAEYGHGKRKGVLSDYTFAVRDERTGELKTIGKAYSGLTDAEIARLTAHFLARVIRQRGRFHEVEPDLVLEIAFDSIQESDRHSSGLAMRFPRIARIREDKTLADIDTVVAARRLAGLV